MKRETLFFRLNPETKHRLKKYCKDNYITMSEILKRLLEEFLENHVDKG